MKKRQDQEDETKDIEAARSEAKPEDVTERMPDAPDETVKKRGFLWRNRRRIAVLLFLLGLLVCLVTLAYFTSRDEVTNTLTGYNADITLLEPTWDSTGAAKAQDAEPGMWIEKDPYVLNNSTDSVYVRMKIVVKVKDDTTGEYTAITDISNTATGALAETYAAVLQALKYENTSGKKVSLIVAKNAVSGTWTSAHSSFYLDTDGWFYYAAVDSDGSTVTCTPLASGASTETLFDGIDLPKEKTDFNNGVFNKDFRIDITAQAVVAQEGQTFETVKASFTKLGSE